MNRFVFAAKVFFRRSGETARSRLAGILLAIGLAGLSGPTLAQTPPAPGVAKFLEAIVMLKAEVPAGARTAAVLGRERQGSAIVIDSNGLMVTIGYLILEANKAEVVTQQGEVVAADILGYDHDTGFGLLRARRPLDVTPLRLGSSAALDTSDEVMIASFGGAAGIRPGFVVSRREFAGYWEYLLERPLYTAPPHPMFPGAALLGEKGQLMGVGSLVVNDALRAERVIPGNLFVPIDLLKPILGRMLVDGQPTESARPWLGVYSTDSKGPVVVGRVAEDSPAQAAGLRSGDAIVGVAGEPVDSMVSFYRKLWRQGGPGDQVRLNVLRGGKLEDVTVKAGDRYEWLKLPDSQ